MTDDKAPNTDAKPKGIAPPKRTERKPRTGRKKSLKKPLEDLFTSLGATVAIFDQFDGEAIITGAPRLAESLNNVAKENDAVYRNLERLVTGSAWGGVFVAAGAIALPILAHHDLLPVQIPGMGQTQKGEPTAQDVPDLSSVINE